MSRHELNGTGGSSALPAVLAGLGNLRLTAGTWRDVEEILTELSAALAAGDVRAVGRLTGELISAAPSRAEERISATQPPPAWVRERVNELVDSLDPPSTTSMTSPTPSAPTGPAIPGGDGARVAGC